MSDDVPDPVMSVLFANALITSAPLTEAELRCVIDHCRTLHPLLILSGPRFGVAARDVAEMHNKAVRRLKQEKEEIRRRAVEDDETLLEIA